MASDTSSDSCKCNLLILGDWVVDDNWVIGVHQSSISTNTGRYHYRSLDHPGNSVQRFCGAARVAAILNSARIGPLDIHLHGIGLWHPQDTNYFYQLFEPSAVMCHTPYLLNKPRPPAPDRSRISLNNLAPVVQAAGYKAVRSGRDNEGPLDEYFGTTRIFRHFQQDRGILKQISRIDWELAPKSEGGTASWLTPSDFDNNDVKDSFKLIIDGLPSIDGVVVKDLCKGVVSVALLRRLLEDEGLGLSTKPWYISTKAWNPAWLSLLKERQVRVKLVLFPQVAFAQNEDVPTWIVARGHPTAEAIESLYKTAESFFSADANPHVCAALSGPKLRAMLMEVSPRSMPLSDARMDDLANKINLFVHPEENPNGIDFSNAVGNASAFFAALVFGFLHRDLQNKGMPQTRIETPILFQSALDTSQYWIAQECMWLEHPEKVAIPSELVLSVEADEDSKPGERGFSRISTLPSSELRGGSGRKISPVRKPNAYQNGHREEWVQSMKDLGIISTGKEGVVQLWRSCVEFPGYVCCVPAKRKVLAKLRRDVMDFRASDHLQSISGLLVAKPGSGKSHFVRRLASDLSLKLLSFNITTLAHKNDLLACFDQIVTTQSEMRRDDKLLVFVDEINAGLAGHPVYDAFLAPLEDGYYIRSSFKFHIRPCIWLFAGTSDEEAIKKDMKGSDFVSRLTMGQINLSLEPGEYPALQKTERVYLGLALGRSVYSDIGSVRRRVLEVLSNLRPGLSSREIRRFVAQNLAASRGQADWKKPKTIYEDNKECFGFSLEERQTLQKQLEQEGDEIIRLELEDK